MPYSRSTGPRDDEALSFEPRTRAQVGQIVARSVASASASPRSEYALAIVQRRSGDLIGVGRIATDPHQPRSATVGFALRSTSWGNGYGVESVLIPPAFDQLGPTRELHPGRSPTCWHASRGSPTRVIPAECGIRLSRLALTACAVLAGARSLPAVSEWVADAPAELLERLGIRVDPLFPKRGRLRRSPDAV